MINEPPHSWRRVKRSSLPGGQTNEPVYVSCITGRVIDERAYQDMLTRWEVPVVVVETQEKKRG